MRVGLDTQIGAGGEIRVDIAARGAPAFTVLLRDLIGAEAFLVFGIKVVADAELRLARGLQIDLAHRIVGAQSGDMERTALAVICAVELGIIFGPLEVGQHIGIGPANVAERGPVVVIAAMAADVDHRVDRGTSAEALAARLITDAAVEAGLRHGIERPVVDLAGDHQDHRTRRGDDPVVVLAAGFQECHRGLGILRQPACDRAAARAPAHHHEIECVGHAWPPVCAVIFGFGRWHVPIVGWAEAGPLWNFWQGELVFDQFWPDPAVTNPQKTPPRPFPKRVGVGTYRSRLRALARGCLLRKPFGTGLIGAFRGASSKPFPSQVFVSGAQFFIAGWSSPVARQAHNLKVIGSNPIPATKIYRVRSGHMGYGLYRRHR